MSIYLDHNATSPMHAEVVDAMLPFLENPVGNPSSLHAFGRMARSAVDSARAQVAELLGCDAASIIFTSGGSEANNLMLKGYLEPGGERPLIGTRIEHPSVLEPLRQLRAGGARVLLLEADGDGRIDLAAARECIAAEDAQLLTVMLANNETGVMQPVAELADLVDRGRCLVHSDATQVIGKLPVDMTQLDVDAISFSAHKLGGPQGVGALVVARKPRQALISGGDQEHRRRAGTENVAGIVGLGKAADLARLEITRRKHHLEQLRDVFESKLSQIAGSIVFGQRAPRLPNTTCFALPYYHGETLLMELDRAGFALASGSSCHSAVTEPSHVLRAMGVDDQIALNAIRVSFGTGNSLQDVDKLASKLQQLVDGLHAVVRRAAV